jgi:hypothetical protein
MHKVNKAFDFYHDGINPTHYPAGEQILPEDAAKVAVDMEWAEPASGKSAPEAGFIAKHRGAGKWDVLNQSGEVVAEGLEKEGAKAKAAELNEAGKG